MQTFFFVINNVLSIVINIQNTTIFEPVILKGFSASTNNNERLFGKKYIDYKHINIDFKHICHALSSSFELLQNTNAQ